jgi:hypothetical protein
VQVSAGVRPSQTFRLLFEAATGCYLVLDPI